MKANRLFCFILAFMFVTVGCKTTPIEIPKRKSLVPRIETPLHRAAKDGFIYKVRSLIMDGADVNAKDDWDGSTPLHTAAEEGHTDVVRLLISKGAEINALNDDGETALHKALFWGNTSVVELLVASGADVNAKDQDGSTPLHEAVVSIDFLSEEEIIEANNIEVGEEYKILEKNIIDIVKLLIKHGADANAKDNYVGTPLHDAVLLGYRDIAELLITNGADVNQEFEDGMPLLHYAVALGFEDVVELLISSGTDIDTRDTHSQTALHEAAWEDYRDISELLIDKGANINVRDKNGDTPLHVAALNGHKELFDLLITKGGDVNVKNKQGKTPVDYANSPAPMNAVVLSKDESRPYSVIITNLRHIRRFLRSEMIDFDQIWIPEKQDLEELNSALRTCLEEKAPVMKKTWFSHDYIFANLHEYNREYTGIFKNGTKYVICNMCILEKGSEPRNNMFTSVYDGGCSFVRVVFEVKTKKVILINCN